MDKTPFQKLREINVNDKTEKKGNLTYLSWAWAVDQLLTADHMANWEYLEPLMFGETVMVRCAVTAFGKTMVAQLPVMDHRNKPIPKPDAFAVNTAMQRCLVKGIALHGLGLYIYAGEDLPDGEEKPEPKKVSPVRPNSAGEDFWNQAEGDEKQFLNHELGTIRDLLNADQPEAAANHFYINAKMDQEEQAAVWSQLNSKERAAIKANKSQPALEKAA